MLLKKIKWKPISNNMLEYHKSKHTIFAICLTVLCLFLLGMYVTHLIATYSPDTVVTNNYEYKEIPANITVEIEPQGDKIMLIDPKNVDLYNK